MLQPEISCIQTKHLVHFNNYPHLFHIYEGMVETVYLISQNVAFTSVCSPGYYKLLRDFVAQLPQPLSIVDDLLGMAIFHKIDAHYSVQTRDYINQLISLSRITWPCDHVVGDAHIPDEGTVWVANPLAFLHEDRLNEINMDVINKHPNVTFIMPIGAGYVAEGALKVYRLFIKRDVIFAGIPAAFIDNCNVIIPSKKLTSIPAVPGMYLNTIHKTVRIGKGNWKLEYEQKLYRSLFGAS